jgi:hypothetical protein
MVATLPAHTEQVVVPSATCAPHILQNAIEVSSSCPLEFEGMRSCSLHETAAKRRCGKVSKSPRQSNQEFQAAENA